MTAEKIDILVVSGPAASMMNLKTTRNLWFPISELKDKYHQPLMVASKKLIDLDFNPEGISQGYWQDEEGWVVNGWDGCGDVVMKIVLQYEDVTHFMLLEGPY